MPEIPILSASSEAAAEIEAALLADLAQPSEQGRSQTITLEVRAPDHVRIGGLSGATSHGWLLIKVLWIAPEWRRQGFGCALVERAVDQARALGCHGVWLDTSDHGAKRFYEALGFILFGHLRNGEDRKPRGHCRWFMRRSIC